VSDIESPRPVVWISHRDGERCAACAVEIERGSFIQISREQGIRCARCAGFGDLAFLPAGDTALTRRALALSARTAIVVKFSRARKCHERQGALVEPAALDRAEEECKADAARREAARERRRPRAERAEQEYLARFVAGILERFPACPPPEATAIARRACEKYSRRVGRSAAARALDPGAITLAVRAHIRHTHTGYEELLARGLEPGEARAIVAGRIERRLRQWQRVGPETS
jgi:hypothetical protein